MHYYTLRLTLRVSPLEFGRGGLHSQRRNPPSSLRLFVVFLFLFRQSGSYLHINFQMELPLVKRGANKYREK
jgi:hypothetical protein